MNIDVHFTTQLRSALGRAQQQVSLPDGSTLAQLLRRLAEERPDVFAKLAIDAQGKPLPNIILCVGDEQAVQPESRVLHDGESVTILSAISGG